MQRRTPGPCGCRADLVGPVAGCIEGIRGLRRVLDAKNGHHLVAGRRIEQPERGLANDAVTYRPPGRRNGG